MSKRKNYAEPGAEGLPQYLVPGVKPVPDRVRLKIQAGKPMRGRSGHQQAEPLPLFEAPQPDLFGGRS